MISHASKVRSAAYGWRKIAGAPAFQGSATSAWTLRIGFLFAIVLLWVFSGTPPASATSRIKDIADIEGVRENQLVGYGLVVGLQGTGDSLRNAPFTRQSLESMLERLGVNARAAGINTANVAAVTVTANLPAFASQGTRIDVTVSALGDSRSLQGGQLLVTPLIGADGQVYAVAQGPVAIAGFSAGGRSGTTLTRGVPTNGRIPAGALVEREIKFELAQQKDLRLSLRNPDLTTAQRMASRINAFAGGTIARATNPGAVQVLTPADYPGGVVRLLSDIENLQVEPDQAAKIIIDEVSGIIVMGENVKISSVALAQGSLTISVKEDTAISQPAPLSAGQTAAVPKTDVTVEEGQGGLALLGKGGGIPLREVVGGLNALGVSPRDLIAILQALKASGALQAEIESF